MTCETDNDASGTGQSKATETAQTVGARLALPTADAGTSAEWNDAHLSQGLGVVRELLTLAPDSPSDENRRG